MPFSKVIFSAFFLCFCRVCHFFFILRVEFLFFYLPLIIELSLQMVVCIPPSVFNTVFWVLVVSDLFCYFYPCFPCKNALSS